MHYIDMHHMRPKARKFPVKSIAKENTNLRNLLPHTRT